MRREAERWEEGILLVTGSVRDQALRPRAAGPGKMKHFGLATMVSSSHPATSSGGGTLRKSLNLSRPHFFHLFNDITDALGTRPFN